MSGQIDGFFATCRSDRRRNPTDREPAGRRLLRDRHLAVGQGDHRLARDGLSILRNPEADGAVTLPFRACCECHPADWCVRTP